jgi:hypothetical protein
MWANSTSTLKADPTEEAGQETLSENQTPIGGTTTQEMNLSAESAPRFRWSPDVVRRLDEDVDWALASNPTGAAEIAGVLLGKIAPIIEITGCQPVFLMQPRDHAYALSGPGKSEFERMIAGFQSIPEGQHSVIGFYRSHIGDGLDLTEEDLGLVREFFPNTSPVVLLMQRSANGSSSAKLFLGDQGEVRQFQSPEHSSALPRWLELWHSLSADGAAPPTAAVDTATLADRTEPAPISKPANPAPDYTPTPIRGTAPEKFVPLERRSNRGPVFLLAALILAILAGYLMLRDSALLRPGIASPRAAAHDLQSGGSHSAGLALRAERNGDDLRLDWDRTAPVLVAATGGMLTIREGKGREKQVMVDGNLLRRGAMVYGPVHGDVFLRLVIFGQEGAKTGESTSTYRPQPTSVSGSDAYKEKQ